MGHMYTGNLQIMQNLIVNNDYQNYDENQFGKAPKITLYVCILYVCYPIEDFVQKTCSF